MCAGSQLNALAGFELLGADHITARGADDLGIVFERPPKGSFSAGIIGPRRQQNQHLSIRLAHLSLDELWKSSEPPWSVDNGENVDSGDNVIICIWPYPPIRSAIAKRL
jgi:hypothetical protein